VTHEVQPMNSVVGPHFFTEGDENSEAIVEICIIITVLLVVLFKLFHL